MPSLRKSLPPVNSLVVFESAARHMNFTKAADELGVSQAAVSRQIQLLEDHLGTLLFQRMPRALQLTTDGAAFQRAVAIGLEHIAKSAADIRHSHRSGAVTVSASVTFSSYWLMTRLMRFRSAHPDVELRLTAASPVRDFAVAGIDLAIRYGTGEWPDVEATRLFDNEIWPVCSPRYLGARKRLVSIEGLLDETLLRLARPDRHWVSWEMWLRAHGIRDDTRHPGIRFDNYLVLLQAALRGEGIALAGARLVEDFIAHGELVRPLEAGLHSERSFYLLQRKDVALSRNGRLFRDWLLGEAKAQRLTPSRDQGEQAREEADLEDPGGSSLGP